MLFKFDKFWKFILITVSSWLVYACAGYEFTAITLLSLILADNLFDTIDNGKKKK
jgi:hypothetical protein